MIRAAKELIASRWWVGRSVVLGLLVLLGAVAYWFGVSSKPVKPPEELVIPGAALDFGTVWENDRFQLKLPLQNVSDHSLEVSDVVPDCTCVDIQPRSFSLNPQEKIVVSLILNLTAPPKGSLSASQEQGPNGQDFVHDIAFFFSPDPQGWRNWTIRGIVRRAVAFDPPSVTFLDTLVHDKPSTITERKVIALTQIPLAKLQASADSSLAIVQVRDLSARHDSFEIAIRPSERLPAGVFKLNVKVHMIASDGSLLPERLLAVTGRINEDIYADPSTILAGSVNLGDVITESVLLRSRTDSSFAVVRIETDDLDSRLTAVETRKPPPRMLVPQYSFRCQVTKLGWQSKHVEFHIRGHDNKLIKVRLPVYYYGKAG